MAQNFPITEGTEASSGSAPMSDTALLAETRRAIDALTTGGVSQYQLNGRMVTKLEVEKLWTQVERLERRIRRARRRTVFGVSTIRADKD